MKKWFVVFCIVSAVGILFGCETNPEDNCGGLDDIVSCVSVTSIAPSHLSGAATTNVDAVQDVCAIDASGDPTPEPFTDHNADITFANEQFPNASNSYSVTIRHFTVSYSLTNCPAAAAGCPALTSIEGERTIVIPKGGQATATFPFVPLAVKEEYVAAGGEVTGSASGGPFPTYTATYIFNATTEPFGTEIEIEGRQDFTIGNFDHCS
jgi:hypothetical protein